MVGSSSQDKTYWVVATETALMARQRTSAAGARWRRMHKKHRRHLTKRARLGIPKVEQIIHLDIFTYGSNNREGPTGSFCSQAAIKLFPGANVLALRQ